MDRFGLWYILPVWLLACTSGSLSLSFLIGKNRLLWRFKIAICLEAPNIPTQRLTRSQLLIRFDLQALKEIISHISLLPGIYYTSAWFLVPFAWNRTELSKVLWLLNCRLTVFTRPLLPSLFAIFPPVGEHGVTLWLFFLLLLLIGCGLSSPFPNILSSFYFPISFSPHPHPPHTHFSLAFLCEVRFTVTK